MISRLVCLIVITIIIIIIIYLTLTVANLEVFSLTRRRTAAPTLSARGKMIPDDDGDDDDDDGDGEEEKDNHWRQW